MEEDKKKKKNKKKKNKQATKPTESVRESTSDNQNNVPETGLDTNGQVSWGDIHASNNVDQNTDIDRHGHLANGNNEKNLAKAEVQYELERDASFQVKELQAEKAEKIQNEAILEEKMKQLLKEKHEYIQKETSLKEKIARLEKENDALVQKEAGLEMNILQLAGEKDSWLQKEVSLEEKIKQMEKERDTWITRENSTKELITIQNNENIKLRAQVIQLKQSSQSLLEEKQLLEENIYSLQTQIKNLETTAGFPHSSMMNQVTSEDGDVNRQTGAACTLVRYLRTENSEIVEKVNELDQSGGRTEDSLSIGSAVEAASSQPADSPALPSNLAIEADNNETARAACLESEASSVMPASDSTLSLEDIMIEDQIIGEHVNEKDESGLANSSEIIEVDESARILLDEKETNLKVAQYDEETEISLTDSPLIGAPFRFISFVARYVSGADLVK